MNGTCVSPNNCSCTFGFTGSQCEVVQCFGVDANNVSVCSNGNGICIRPNICSCSAGYSGIQCENTPLSQIITCYGVMKNDSRVCSFGNGNCVENDTCICNTGYYGNQCNVTSCFGFLSNDTRVCTNGNGTCVKNNVCTCNTGYYGNECQFYSLCNETSCMATSCYGLMQNDSRVCNNRNGTCGSFNRCTCNDGYFGNQCEIPICYGKQANDSSVCNFGTCIKPNLCVCSKGWEGLNCTAFHCNELNNCNGNGVCAGPNTCLCNADKWIGSNCSIPICFGKAASDPQACNGNGHCVSNMCNCKPGYQGNQCQFTTCANINSSLPSVCSGNGKCIAPDTCSCNVGYSGATCNYMSCFGIASSDFRVCSQRGACIAPDTCLCESKYADYACQAPKCNDIPSYSSLVCNGRGNCSAPDVCSCSLGYLGSFCEQIAENLISCYERTQNDKLVCSGNGKCYTNNNCTCNTGYTGYQCQTSVCYGKPSTSFDVCSGNGNCIGPDKCQCYNGFSGNQCQNFMCYGYLANSSISCSGNGKCILPDTCQCVSGYQGKCDVPICFNLNASDNRVCSGNGRCIAPNQCVCNIGYSDFQCSTKLCFGQPHTYLGICSGHGSCTSPNFCTCSSGYMGQQCEIPTCFGLSSSDANVCNGKGVCIANNTCNCFANNSVGFWNGNPQCSACSPDYSGINCTIPICDDTITCSSHGVCNTNTLTCQCIANSVSGYFSGPYCSICAQHYYGPNCTIFCRPIENCNGHGTCNSAGTCKCFNDDINGHFDIASACSTCLPGWYGKNCSTSVSTSFYFSPTYDTMVGALHIRTEDFSPVSISCELLFANADKLGNGATCHWPNRLLNSSYFEVIFGSNPSLLPGDIISLNLLFFEPATRFVTVSVIGPSNSFTISAFIVAPPTVSVCDGVTLDGSLSSSSDRRALTYKWRIVNGIRLGVIGSYLSTVTKQRAVIDSSLLDAGFTYTFALQVINFLGVKSTEYFINVTKVADVIPVATIRGSPIQVTYVNNFFKLEGSAVISECFYSNAQLDYLWKQISGPKVQPTSGTRSSLLFFAPYTFPVFDHSVSYIFEFSVSPVANPSVSTSQSVTVMVSPQPLVAQVTESKRIESRNDTIKLDASLSYDPDQVASNASFTWTCLTYDGAYCVFYNQYVLPRTPVIFIPPFTLPVGEFNFTVFFTKGARMSSASILLTVVQGTPPKVLIRTSLPTKINKDEKIVVQGSATLSDGLSSANLRYNWKVFTGANLEVPLKSSNLLTSTTETTLVIKPGVLTVGQTYTFLFTAIYVEQRRQAVISGYAASSLTTINDPPRQGVFIVEPATGTSMQTTFTLSMSQFTDLDAPIQYSFGYYQGDQLITLALLSPSNYASFYLPVGNSSLNYTLTVFGRVFDKYGAITQAIQNVYVLPIPNINSTQVVQKATESLSIVSKETNNEQVNQLVSTVTQLLNSPVIDTTPITSPNNCPNQCSGRGSCANTVCFCDLGWATSDCSITSQELEKRQELRLQLLTSLIQSSNETFSKQPLTVEVVTQQAEIVAQITSKAEELNSKTSQLAVSYIESLITASLTSDAAKGQEAVLYDEVVANSLTKSLSNIAVVAFVSNGTNSTSNDSKNLATAVYNAVNVLCSAVLLNKAPGEEATQITQPTIAMALKKEYATKLGSLKFTVNQFNLAKTSATVVFPPNGISTAKRAAQDSLNLQAVNYVGNPYAWAGTSNISSTVLSFSLKSDTNTEIRVSNLTNPMLLTIPGEFNSSNLVVGCLLTKSSVPSCKYWNAEINNWSTYGCKPVNITNSYIICACNHLTDFGGFVQDIIPEMNLLTVDDLIAQLNPDNLMTLIVMLILLAIYIVLMIVFYFVDVLFAAKSDEERKITQELVKMGKFRMIIETFRTMHIWVSLISRPVLQKTFTRPQRLTVVYVIILITLTINALFFGTHQATVIKTFSASIISQYAGLPFIVGLIWIFSNTRLFNPKKQIIKTIPVQMINTVGDFEMEEFSKKKFAPESNSQIFRVPLKVILARKEEALELVPKTISNMLAFIDTYPDKNGLFNAAATDSEVQFLKTKMDNGDDINFSKYKINTICSAFQLFLAQLPEPLLPASTLPHDDVSPPKLIAYLQTLPKEQYHLLKRIVEVVVHLVENKSHTAESGAQLLSLLLSQDEKSVTLRTIDTIYVLFIQQYHDIFASEISVTEGELNKKSESSDLFTSLHLSSNIAKHVQQVKKVNSQAAELEQRMIDRKEKRKSLKVVRKNETVLLTNQISKALDIGDNLFDRAELKIRQTSSQITQQGITPYTVCVFVVVAICYFTLVAGGCLIMELVFARSWKHYLTTLVVCVSFILPLFGFMYLYFNQKREKFRLEQRWDIYIPSLVFAGIMAAFFIVTAILALIIASSLQFWRLTFGIEHTGIIAGSQLVLAAHFIAFIFLTLRKPKLVVQDIHAPKEAPLPPWILFIVYPITWGGIAVMCWVLVAYGTKFGTQKANAWLAASFLGLGQNVFIQQPADVFFQAIFVTMITNVMNAIIFSSSTVVATVALEEQPTQ